MNQKISVDYLNLLNVSGVGPQRVRSLLSRFKTPENIWAASLSDLCSVDGINRSSAQAILDYSNFDYGLRQIEIADKLGISIICYSDETYPLLLKRIYDPPLLLFVKGNGLAVKQDCLGIVGTRLVSDYGKRITKELAGALSKYGLVIVSGLARGVDTIAHKETLSVGGITLAVLGCGLDRVYPAENKKLFDEIVEKDGALLSEFPFGTKPDAGNFPQRNRIISGLSHATVVVEAGDKSGAMLTAMNAIDQNREVFAVPGRITDKQSVGTNRLIRHGAIPVLDADQILENLQSHLFYPNQPKQETIQIDLTPDQRKIIIFLLDDPVHIDELSKLTDMDITLLLGTLLQMELQGSVRQLAGKMFVSN